MSRPPGATVQGEDIFLAAWTTEGALGSLQTEPLPEGGQGPGEAQAKQSQLELYHSPAGGP